MLSESLLCENLQEGDVILFDWGVLLEHTKTLHKHFWISENTINHDFRVCL